MKKLLDRSKVSKSIGVVNDHQVRNSRSRSSYSRDPEVQNGLSNSIGKTTERSTSSGTKTRGNSRTYKNIKKSTGLHTVFVDNKSKPSLKRSKFIPDEDRSISFREEQSQSIKECDNPKEEGNQGHREEKQKPSKRKRKIRNNSEYKVNSEEAKKLLETDKDFVNLKRFDYSLSKVIKRYPEGCPDRVIANALMMSEDEVEETFNKVLIKLRNLMKVKL